MQYRIKISAVCLALFLILPFFAVNSYCDIIIKERNDFKNVPGLYLLYPVTDDIVLTGKDYLEFKWRIADFVDTDHFEFRIYKGYNTVEANLILKQNFPSDTYPIKVPANFFQVNQVYTWVLIQVFRNGEKGGRSYSPFKIIKK